MEQQERKLYSQHEEEQVIQNILKEKGITRGRFLDIGAADGINLSNTWRLVEQGWSGVFVEANPAHVEQLLENVEEQAPDPDKLTVVGLGISTERGIVEFHSCLDLVSTMDNGHKEIWEGGDVHFRRMFIQTVTVEDLINRFGGGFQVVSLDIERKSADVFLRLPFEALNADVIVVEHDERHVEIGKVAHDQGYVQRWVSGENIIYARP